MYQEENVRKLFKVFMLMNSMSLLLLFSGCGKDDDKLVMVTTERKTEDVSVELGTKTDVDVAAATTEIPKEEASEADKAISIDAIITANKGDDLLKGGKSYKLTRQYKSNGKDDISEEYFLGFDSEGKYVQTFSNSDGYLQIADRLNGYWFVVENGVTTVLICPDDIGFNSSVDFQHNYMMFSGTGLDGDDLSILDVYRQSGELVVEMQDAKMDRYKYTLQDDYIVKSCEYSTEAGEVFCVDTVTAVDTLTLPKDIVDYRNDEDVRVVSVEYPGNDSMGGYYYLPKNIEFKLTENEYYIYADEEGSQEWKGDTPGEDGKYEDCTLYIYTE